MNVSLANIDLETKIKRSEFDPYAADSMSKVGLIDQLLASGTVIYNTDI